ncbi:MaoC family dehydratase [Comamonadaceae bacterium M7527]|nr:MaoC family dehydratase [Comamonadaceae bacterium M7527]
MRRFEQLSDVAACVGQDVAVSDWVLIDQAMINTFADATGDHQWIHVDPVRAAKGPFGAPVAHGFLTLSLLPKFFDTTFDIAASSMGVNYGLNRVRFMSPVPANSRVRGHMHLLASEPVAGDGLQLTWRVTVEIEGVDKPACVAESVVRRYP